MNHLNIEQFNQAGYPLLWVVTNEPNRVVRECTVEKKFHWDISRGLSRDLIHYEESDPLEVIRQIIEPQEAVIFLENFHHFLENPNVMQGLLNATSVMKSKGTTIVILSPVLKIPPELNPVVRVLMHDLPEDAEYHKCLRDVLEENSTLSDTELQSIVQAGKGMTLAGYEDALALSLVKDGQITPKAIWNEKADMIKKSGLAEIYHGQEKFDDIGGLDGLKQFCLRSLTSGRSGSRGVMLLGVPGTGKSLFAKALGNEVGRCTISLEMSKMYSSLVGETERNIRETLQVIDKLEPSIVFIDEIEKALSGIQSSGRTDGGTGSRVFSTFLQWLNDHQSDSYVIATCNSIDDLPPEFLRQERWDGIFFVDLPNYEEREQIWKMYKGKYEIEGKHPESINGWSGAEIKSACRLSYLQNISLEESIKMTIPLTISASEKIEGIRKKAGGKSLSASTGEIYQYTSQGSTKRRINSMMN